jgi:hypothetical protein
MCEATSDRQGDLTVCRRSSAAGLIVPVGLRHCPQHRFTNLSVITLTPFDIDRSMIQAELCHVNGQQREDHDET